MSEEKNKEKVEKSSSKEKVEKSSSKESSLSKKELNITSSKKSTVKKYTVEEICELNSIGKRRTKALIKKYSDKKLDLNQWRECLHGIVTL